jgi:type VI protein secretion system component VasK
MGRARGPSGRIHYVEERHMKGTMVAVLAMVLSLAGLAALLAAFFWFTPPASLSGVHPHSGHARPIAILIAVGIPLLISAVLVPLWAQRRKSAEEIDETLAPRNRGSSLQPPEE